MEEFGRPATTVIERAVAMCRKGSRYILYDIPTELKSRY